VNGDRICLLIADSPFARIAYHGLAREFAQVSVICEERVSRRALLRRRTKKLGRVTVVGQLLFSLLIVPLLTRRSADRIEAIQRQFNLDTAAIPEPLHHVHSINADATLELLDQLAPAVVVVVGTRIIGRHVLDRLQAPVINLHAGITPLYRGVHGGYWAFADRRPDLAGVTVHLVDAGIDTGSILARATFERERDDSFVTYPYLQIGVGLPLLLDAVRRAFDGTLRPLPDPPALPSKLRSHPTIWGYLHGRVRFDAR